MSLRVEIEDSKFGTRNSAGVTQRGQLIVSPLKFNTAFFQSMTATDTAYNFVIPKAGQQFVIDGLIFSSAKDVNSTNGAEIKIFETDAVDSISSSKDLLTLDIGRLDRGSISSLNLITNPGVWVNATTDDATTHVTIIGYYVEVVD